MESDLLRSVSACVEELSEIRKELQNVDGRVRALDTHLGNISEMAQAVHLSTSSKNDAASEQVPAPSDGVGRRPSTADGNRGSLSDLCMIEDPVLKSIFVAACSKGELRLELSTLAARASEGLHLDAGWVTKAVVQELERGSLRALVATATKYLEGDSIGKPFLACSRTSPSVLHDIKRRLQSDLDSEDHRVILAPVFREGSWSLLEAAIRWCQREKVPSRLDVLFQAVRSLLRDHGSFREANLFALASLAPEAARLLSGGELVTGWNPEDETLVDDISQASALAVHPFLEQAMMSLSSEAAILDLLVLLREQRFLQVWGLPSDDVKFLTGRGLIKLLEEPSNSTAPLEIMPETIPEQGFQLPPPSTTGSAMGSAMGMCFSETSDSSLQSANTNMQATGWIGSSAGSELARIAATGSTDPNKMDMGSSDEEEEGDAGGVQAQVLLLQAAFIKCFSEELASQRPLLLSQLNNLYKMRSGEELNYKIAGYEKLRDFLMEVPGLSLIGRGNRMQVRVSDEEAFAVFQEGLEQHRAELGQTPNFHMPAPLPESLQQKLYDLFLGAENYEIPLRNFLNVWNARYPMEQLAYRNLGFRDVRGVLSNVPFIEKVGGKSDAKYVLRGSEIAQLSKAGNKNADKPMIVRPTNTRSDVQGLQSGLLSPSNYPTGSPSSESAKLLRPPGMFGPNAPSREPRNVQAYSGGLGYSQSSASDPALANKFIANLREAGVELDPGLLVSRQNPVADTDDSRRLQLGSWLTQNGNVRGSNSNAEFVQPSFVKPLSPTGGRSPTTLGLQTAPNRPRKSLGLAVPLTVDEERLEAPPGVEGDPLSVPNPSGDVAYPGTGGGLIAAQGNRKVTGKKKQASFFVSSPGAFSSDTRDMGIHQGKFDMCSVLQTQLKQGSPSLVCDISGGQVMVTNNECEDLFETHDTESRLVQNDVYSLIHDEDRDQFSNHFAYLLVSEKTRMEPQELRVTTLLGNTRYVRCEGVQLIGIWWQLNFIRLDPNSSLGSKVDQPVPAIVCQ